MVRIPPKSPPSNMAAQPQEVHSPQETITEVAPFQEQRTNPSTSQVSHFENTPAQSTAPHEVGTVVPTEATAQFARQRQIHTPGVTVLQQQLASTLPSSEYGIEQGLTAQDTGLGRYT